MCHFKRSMHYLRNFMGLAAHMMLYNEERFHQALGNDTPSNVYRTGIGGGAMIQAQPKLNSFLP